MTASSVRAEGIKSAGHERVGQSRGGRERKQEALQACRVAVYFWTFSLHCGRVALQKGVWNGFEVM